MWHDIDTWRTALLGLAALGQTTFVVLYLTFPWWGTFFGRALFYKALTLAIFLDVVWVARTFGYRPDELYVTLYGFLAVGIWWQVWAFLNSKRKGVRAGEDTHV